MQPHFETVTLLRLSIMRSEFCCTITRMVPCWLVWRLYKPKSETSPMLAVASKASKTKTDPWRNWGKVPVYTIMLTVKLMPCLVLAVKSNENGGQEYHILFWRQPDCYLTEKLDRTNLGLRHIIQIVYLEKVSSLFLVPDVCLKTRVYINKRTCAKKCHRQKFCSVRGDLKNARHELKSGQIWRTTGCKFWTLCDLSPLTMISLVGTIWASPR